MSNDDIRLLKKAYSTIEGMASFEQKNSKRWVHEHLLPLQEKIWQLEKAQSQSDSEQIKSLEKEAEEKYPLQPREVFTNGEDGSQAHWFYNEVAKKQREAYIAGAQITEQPTCAKNAQVEDLEFKLHDTERVYQLKTEQLEKELKEKDEQLRNERELFVQTTAKQAGQFHQLQAENAQLKEELKHEELKMEAIQGHVDALWEENAQLKGKVAEAAEKAIDYMKENTYPKFPEGEDAYDFSQDWQTAKAEYLKSITDKTENP